MNKKVISIIVLTNALMLSTGFVSGYLVGKKRYSPNKIYGELLIDHTEDPNNPYVYLSVTDRSVFESASEYIQIHLKHVRK